MDNKKIITIGAIILIILGILIITLTNVGYERIEITSNGTSIDIPTTHKYQGDIQGVKLWNWNNGALVTYNNQSASNSIKLTGLVFNSITDLVKTNNPENIDGFTIYTLDGDKLLDSFKINANGKFYCIYLTNETTNDNIVICCNNKDVTLHMAKSIDYKN